MPPIPIKRREVLLKQITAANRLDLVKTLLTARGHIEDRMMRAARNKTFATVRRIREGIYKDIQTEYVALQGNLDEWTKRSIRKTAKVFHGLSVEDLNLMDGDKAVIGFTKFSKKHLDDYFSRIHPFNAEKMAAVNVQMNPQLTRMLDTDVRALQRATVEAFREAQVAGMTSQERYKLLQGKVMDYADNPQSWAFIDRTGKKWSKGNYFNMLNRTVSANVARDSYNDTLISEDRDLVQIIGGVGSNSNEGCRAYDGRVVSLTGNTAGFPTLQDYIDAGGFHPNCVHTTVYVSDKFERGQRLIAEQEGEPKPVIEKPVSIAKTSTKKADAPNTNNQAPISKTEPKPEINKKNKQDSVEKTNKALSNKETELAKVTNISSQRYIDEDVVDEKRKNKDYDVMVSPTFNIDGDPVRVILDGHHSMRAAELDGVKPVYIEQSTRESDKIALLEKGDIESFLESTWMDSDWYNVSTGKDYF